MLLHGLVLISCLWVQSAHEEAARKATDFLISHQQEDGTFKGRAREGSAEGRGAVIGLAILSDRGWCPPVEKLTRHFLDGIRNGNPSGKTYKGLYEDGYIALFLAELGLLDKHGRIKLPGNLKTRLMAELPKIVAHFETTQTPDGVWPYKGGSLNGYKETAVNLPIHDFYRMVMALGLPEPKASLDRSFKFIRSRWKDRGLVNGDMEKEPSIHLTPAALASMIWWKEDRKCSDLIEDAHKFNAVREGSGYLSQWKYDEYDKIPKNLRGQAKSLVERRQMFGLFHLCLSYLREGNEKFERIHKKAASLLIANQSASDQWKSTLGVGGATAFAVLTLNLAKRDALTYFWPDPSKPGAGGPAVWLGAMLKETEGDLIVTKTQSRTTAKSLKLKKKDVLLKLNGRDVTDAAVIPEILAEIRPGQEVTAVVRRKKKDVTLKGKAAKMPSNVKRWKPKKLKGWF